jgi:hypothetical protein
MSKTLTLSTTRLDTLFNKNKLSSCDYDFWIVDLQGAELLALQGAGELLKSCIAIYIEISKVEIYKGGVLWSELLKWLASKGFIPLWQPENAHDDVLFYNKQQLLEMVRKQFQSEHYLTHNRKRLQHLNSLNLPLYGRKVLEVGAGVGDHSLFYIEKDCHVTITENRPEILVFLEQRFEGNVSVNIRQLDMDNPY